MFVSRYVRDLPESGSAITIQLALPVTRGYTAVLRRITASLQNGFMSEAASDAGHPMSPRIEIIIMRGVVSVREGGQNYIGGLIIQPIIALYRQFEDRVDYTLPLWSQRSFMTLEERYVLPGDVLKIENTNYTSVDVLGLRIEYTQERLSDLEIAQANLR
jgi:hypothetical protein